MAKTGATAIIVIIIVLVVLMLPGILNYAGRVSSPRIQTGTGELMIDRSDIFAPAAVSLRSDGLLILSLQNVHAQPVTITRLAVNDHESAGRCRVTIEPERRLAPGEEQGFWFRCQETSFEEELGARVELTFQVEGSPRQEMSGAILRVEPTG